MNTMIRMMVRMAMRESRVAMRISGKYEVVKGGNEVNEGGGEAHCKVVPVSAGSQ